RTRLGRARRTLCLPPNPVAETCQALPISEPMSEDDSAQAVKKDNARRMSTWILVAHNSPWRPHLRALFRDKLVVGEACAEVVDDQSLYREIRHSHRTRVVLRQILRCPRLYVLA